MGSRVRDGGQNDFRYAYFPMARRLVVEDAGQVRIYDTLDHQIGGVSQQQSGMGGSFTFSSQYGQFSVESLPMISPASAAAPASPFNAPQTFDAPTPPSAPAQFSDYTRPDDVFSALDRLGNLRDRGILTEDEFLAKKRELLARL
ncbi:MAG TPA: SHOCT domain-containing protein [Polyangiales bacterium]|nr:SHOCT domain-containing protein [Polyangiales bacterium]